MLYAILKNAPKRPLELMPQTFYSPEEATRHRIACEEAFQNTGITFYVREIRDPSDEIRKGI